MNTSVSTDIKVELSEVELRNIKVTKSYDILFPFSLSYMGYKTLVETQHNDSGTIHSQPDEGSNNTVCN